MNNLININLLTDHLIRPPKFTYSINDLGSPIFQLNNQIYERIDFHVQAPSQNPTPSSLPTNSTSSLISKINQNKIAITNKIYGSIWRTKIIKKSSLNNNLIIIYLHCNCGSRVQSLQLINRSLQHGYTFVSFDSRACGHSQGQYISLGYHQIYDLQAIIQYITEHHVKEPQIVLWGRSMGAVTAINYLAKEKKYARNVKVAVLDSPFINLKQVICEIANKKIGAPKIFIELFVSYMEPMIQEKAGFKVSQFDLRDQIGKIRCPLILMASKEDGLVPFKHLQQIYDTHQGKKSIFYLSQTHTDQRTNETIGKIFRAISRYYSNSNSNSNTNLTSNSNTNLNQNQNQNQISKKKRITSQLIPSQQTSTTTMTKTMIMAKINNNTNNISKLNMGNLLSFRTSDKIQNNQQKNKSKFIEVEIEKSNNNNNNNNTSKKKENRKKIQLTCSNSSGRGSQIQKTDYSIQKSMNNNNKDHLTGERFHRTQAKKQKLSLNHCKSSTKIKGPVYTRIQLFSSKQIPQKQQTCQPIKFTPSIQSQSQSQSQSKLHSHLQRPSSQRIPIPSFSSTILSQCTNNTPLYKISEQEFQLTTNTLQKYQHQHNQKPNISHNYQTNNNTNNINTNINNNNTKIKSVNHRRNVSQFDIDIDLDKNKNKNNHGVSVSVGVGGHVSFRYNNNQSYNSVNQQYTNTYNYNDHNNNSNSIMVKESKQVKQNILTKNCNNNNNFNNNNNNNSKNIDMQQFQKDIKILNLPINLNQNYNNQNTNISNTNNTSSLINNYSISCKNKMNLNNFDGSVMLNNKFY